MNLEQRYAELGLSVSITNFFPYIGIGVVKIPEFSPAPPPACGNPGEAFETDTAIAITCKQKGQRSTILLIEASQQTFKPSTPNLLN